MGESSGLLATWLLQMLPTSPTADDTLLRATKDSPADTVFLLVCHVRRRLTRVMSEHFCIMDEQSDSGLNAFPKS